MNERLLKFIDGLKAESKIAAESEKTSENIAVATEKNNFQKDGGKIMSRQKHAVPRENQTDESGGRFGRNGI